MRVLASIRCPVLALILETVLRELGFEALFIQTLFFENLVEFDIEAAGAELASLRAPFGKCGALPFSAPLATHAEEFSWDRVLRCVGIEAGFAIEDFLEACPDARVHAFRGTRHARPTTGSTWGTGCGGRRCGLPCLELAPHALRRFLEHTIELVAREIARPIPAGNLDRLVQFILREGTPDEGLDSIEGILWLESRVGIHSLDRPAGRGQLWPSRATGGRPSRRRGGRVLARRP
jgi:hypothetical protein